jgi:hypothetical protein
MIDTLYYVLNIHVHVGAHLNGSVASITTLLCYGVPPYEVTRIPGKVCPSWSNQKSKEDSKASTVRAVVTW